MSLLSAEVYGPDGPDGAATTGESFLPYARSFLVQFSADTDPGLRRAVGRVEHVPSGRRSPFTSIEGLCASIAAVLAAVAAGAGAGEKAPAVDAGAGASGAQTVQRQSRSGGTRARRAPARRAGAARRTGKRSRRN